MENENTEKLLEELDQTLATTNERLAKQNSLGRRFLLGIVQGLGGAIGLTIVAGIVLSLLAQLVQSLEAVPLLDRVIDVAGQQFEQRLEQMEVPRQ